MKRKRGAIVDTGFWFALYDNEDKHHSQAKQLADSFSFHSLLIPWPTLFEVINTKFAKKRWAGVVDFSSTSALFPSTNPALNS